MDTEDKKSSDLMQIGMASSPNYEEETTLSDLLRPLWRARYKLFTGILAIGVLVVILMGFLFIISPYTRSTTLTFRVDFQGVEQNQYPNGEPFSPQDFLAPIVVQTVYESNNLQQYGKLEEFRRNLSILQQNDKSALLDAEFKAKLENTRLTQPDRLALEKEYQEKKAAIKGGTFILTFSHTGRLSTVPTPDKEKVLRDLLNAWAEQADRYRGAYKYRLSIFSKNVINKKLLLDEDYIIGLDILRVTLNDIITNTEKIMVLPGAVTYRIGGRDDGFTLPEVRLYLDKIRTFMLQPLIALIQQTGFAKDKAYVTIYLENRIKQTGIDKGESDQRSVAIDRALGVYMQDRQTSISSRGSTESGDKTGLSAGRMDSTVLIPQLSDSFLDRIVDMSKRNSDVQFRQKMTEQIMKESLESVTRDKETKYYESLLQAVAKGEREQRFEVMIQTRIEMVIDELLASLEKIMQIYNDLSSRNLNPGSHLYTVLGAASTVTNYAIPLNRLLAIGLITGLLLLMLLVAAIYIKSRKSFQP